MALTRDVTMGTDLPQRQTGGTYYPSGTTLAIDGTLEIGGVAVTATAAEINAAAGTGVSSTELDLLDGALAGTVVADKAIAVDANKDVASFRNVTVANLDAGASGTAGSVDVFPTTASKGKLAITCTAQTGDTTVDLVAGAMAAARTITIRDPGAAASLLTTTDATAAATTSTAVELTRAADVSTRSVAAGATLAVTEASHEGRTIRLDTASGSVCTLPAPVIGARFRFVVSVKPTSNFHQIKVAAGTDFMAGSLNILDLDGSAQAAFYGDGTADDNIQLNGTTTGGQVGDWIQVEGISATQWAVTGTLACPTGSNPADMFSAAV